MCSGALRAQTEPELPMTRWLLLFDDFDAGCAVGAGSNR
jgi:hypothetical protein